MNNGMKKISLKLDIKLLYLHFEFNNSNNCFIMMHGSNKNFIDKNIIK